MVHQGLRHRSGPVRSVSAILCVVAGERICIEQTAVLTFREWQVLRNGAD